MGQVHEVFPAIDAIKRDPDSKHPLVREVLDKASGEKVKVDDRTFDPEFHEELPAEA